MEKPIGRGYPFVASDVDYFSTAPISQGSWKAFEQCLLPPRLTAFRVEINDTADSRVVAQVHIYSGMEFGSDISVTYKPRQKRGVGYIDTKRERFKSFSLEI